MADKSLPLDNTQTRVRYFQNSADMLADAGGFPGQLHVAADGGMAISLGTGSTPVSTASPFAGGPKTLTLTALASGGQGVAPNITTNFTIVTTVANAADSCTLPNATGSQALYCIVNAAASNSTTIYGFTGDKINGGSANAGVTCAAGKARMFLDAAANNWQSWLSA